MEVGVELKSTVRAESAIFVFRGASQTDNSLFDGTPMVTSADSRNTLYRLLLPSVAVVQDERRGGGPPMVRVCASRTLV